MGFPLETPVDFLSTRRQLVAPKITPRETIAPFLFSGSNCKPTTEEVGRPFNFLSRDLSQRCGATTPEEDLPQKLCFKKTKEGVLSSIENF